MGQAAVAWQRALRMLGVVGQVWADEVSPEHHALVRPLSEFRCAADDVVLYHHGIASSLAGKLLHVDCVRGVVFHNITPPGAYRGTQLEEALISGRAQLAALAEGVDLSIGVSQYNAAELREAGHQNVFVVPLFVEPERFAAARVEKLRAPGRAPTLLSVSRVVPHKRVEDLVSLHAEVRRLSPDAQLVIVGGYAPGHASFRALEARAREVGNVRFAGRVTHEQLVAAYRDADVYVSMSEHEGFGVPLLEAFASDLPVLAFGAAAVPETMGGAGIVFDEKHFAGLAEVVMMLGRDDELRGRLIAGQRARVAQFSLDATAQALSGVLELPARRAPRRRAKRKVAIVVQRYGPHITGGAEAHARMVAERLTAHAQVEVLTSCARDHLTWANEEPPGPEQDGDVLVHRFPSAAAREMRSFNARSRSLFGRQNDLVAEELWLADQGPRLPGLMEALAFRRDEFDAFIFFTALYAPTAHGLPLVADKALLVPTAHDEPPMAFGLYADAITRARALLCNTPEEAAFLAARFPRAARQRVVGVGVEPLRGDGDAFREQFGLKGPYLLYVGRLEDGKGVGDLVRLHQRLVKHFHDAPTLVLVGSGELRVSGTRVVKTGRVDEQTKWDALAGALAVVVPSRYESLSLLTLEAFAAGTPVLANGASDVLAGQLSRSLAGATFDLSELESFVAALKVVGDARDVLSVRAKEYAQQFTWGRVIDAYVEEIDRLR
jgi:glycosyltransferase involved in cell wall biosynthesis